MTEKIVKLFEINTDAIATNRGFYYQYLIVLKKWISNFIDDNNTVTLSEVEDDIKEVGNGIIFTQVKSYTSSFSLNSKEVRKSLFNFFILYSKYKTLNEEITFCFSTNTHISQKERLLKKWVEKKILEDDELLVQCIHKVKKILTKEVNDRKIKLLQRKNSEQQKEEIKKISTGFKNSLDNECIESFIKKVFWEFNNLSPEKGIELITLEIHDLLKNKKFDDKPPSLIFKVLLSEIFKSSQEKDNLKRSLNNGRLHALVKQTEAELKPLINDDLINLFKIELEALKADIADLIESRDLHFKDIKSLQQEIKSNSSKTLPKHLNLVPDYLSQEIFGFENFLNRVHSILNNKKIVSIYAEGGMGKTSFGQKFLRTFDTYNHIIWINVENSISSSFVLDHVLRSNLDLPNTTESEVKHSAFGRLLNELNKIKGENLIIIDIQESEKELEEIKSLHLSSNWQKLILTRSNLKTLPREKLPRLEFPIAKQVYLAHSKKQEENNQLLLEFFLSIDYNVLVIELVSKTIKNSFNLSLSDLVNAWKSQELDSNNFKIDIEIVNKNNSIEFFNYLLERFSLPLLTSNERLYLEWLSVLPSNNIGIEDLILIGGAQNYEENKVIIPNTLNSLEKKGLIHLSEDRKRINIHKIIREVIIYNERKQPNPFIACLFFIPWLTQRIKEGYNTPKDSFRYLRYAESVINSIKEEYRSVIYQPLLLLENEFFYSIRFYLGAKNELPKLIDLANRAGKYSGMNERELGIIYNNLALSYSETDKRELAIRFFKKALKHYPKAERDALILKITTLNNLSSLYLLEKDLVNAMECFKKVQKIRQEYSLYDDQQLCIEFRILSRSYAIAGDYKKAIDLLESGIRLHKTLQPIDRNDFYLAAYHNELSNLFLGSGNINKAIEHQEIGINILEEMELKNSNYLLAMYEISENLYRYLGLSKKEMEIKEKIAQFKVYQS